MRAKAVSRDSIRANTGCPRVVSGLHRRPAHLFPEDEEARLKVPPAGWFCLSAAACFVGCAGGIETGDPGVSRADQALGGTSTDTEVCSGGRLRCFSRIHSSLETNGPGGFAPIGGFGPADLASAYNLDTTLSPGATVAIVDAFGYPNAESDLATYRSNYALPACSVASGCLTIVNQDGQTSPLPPAPTAADDWTVETALDLELASSGCPNCKILLVEANNDQDDGLFQAQLSAVKLGATVISNSWGETEQSLAADGGQPASFYEQYFDHPGVETFVAAGDQGYDNNNTGPDYPSTSEYVTAVGGTSLTKSTTAARGWTEKAWGSIFVALTGAGGSSCSLSIPKPSWQGTTKCNFRAASDVAAVGDPSTGLAVYNNGPSVKGWTVVGGTSAASPFVASVYALTGHGAATPQLSYQNPTAFYDVTTGTNGACFNILCNAGVGWDGPSGNGTPNGRALSGIACVPNCTGRQCGTDGCSGSCGTCPGTESCSPTGQCVCTPQCAGKTCGPDGCGGSCGVCPNPTVSFTSPASGATISGTVTVSFTTTNTTASSSLQAQIDSATLGQATGTAFTKTWDTTATPNGSHTLVGTALEGGFSGTASLPVTVSNPVTVAITSPTAGQAVSGMLPVTATAHPTATATLTKIEVYADGVLAGTTISSPGTVTFDTGLLTVGTHALTAKGYDSSGATGTSAPVQVSVQSGSTGGPDGGPQSGADGGGNTTLNGQGCGCGASGADAPWALAFFSALAAAGVRRARRSALK
jgi:hypothetical protein